MRRDIYERVCVCGLRGWGSMARLLAVPGATPPAQSQLPVLRRCRHCSVVGSTGESGAAVCTGRATAGTTATIVLLIHDSLARRWKHYWQLDSPQELLFSTIMRARRTENRV